MNSLYYDRAAFVRCRQAANSEALVQRLEAHWQQSTSRDETTIRLQRRFLSTVTTGPDSAELFLLPKY